MKIFIAVISIAFFIFMLHFPTSSEELRRLEEMKEKYKKKDKK